MKCQLENIQVKEFYKDEEYDDDAPYNLHSTDALWVEPDKYQRMAMSAMTFYP